MNRPELERIEELALEVARRAAGFASRGSAIFNGSILAEELLGVAVKIRNLGARAELSNGDGT
jgi:hypothetical protein